MQRQLVSFKPFSEKLVVEFISTIHFCNEVFLQKPFDASLYETRRGQVMLFVFCRKFTTTSSNHQNILHNNVVFSNLFCNFALQLCLTKWQT